jgi:hypothetical protein
LEEKLYTLGSEVKYHGLGVLKGNLGIGEDYGTNQVK